MRAKPLSPILTLAVVLAATALATLARWLLDPALGNNLPLIFTFGAVAAAVWLSGSRAGLLATVLNYLIADYLFMSPRGSMAFDDPVIQVGGIAYLGTCLIIIAFGDAHRRARQRLDVQRQWLDTTVRSIGDAVIATDKDGRVLLMNQVAESLTGWKDHEASGRELEEVFRIVNEKTGAPAENPVAKALATGRIVGLANHTILISQDGTKYPIDDSAAPIRWEGGEIAGVVLVFRDVTEQRRAERDARFLASIVESSNDAIISKDIDGIVTSWNKAAERIFGYTAAEAVGMPISTLASPNRPDEMKRILERIRGGERVEHFDTERRAKDGSLIPISLTVSPVRDEDGEIIGASKIVRDISERRRSEERLHEEKARLQTTLLSIGDGVIVTDHDGRISMLNPVASSLTGWGDEAIGLPIDDIFRIVNEQTREPVENPVKTVLREGRIVGLANHTILIAKDGSERPIDDSAAPILDEAGKLAGSVLVFRDVAVRRAAEKRIYDLMLELKNADHRKDEFLATLAHELRGPLAPLRNMLEVMKRAENAPAIVERSRDSMERQLGQMIRLVDDLLDVSRITRNKLELRLEHVELSNVIHHSVEASRPMADKAGHALKISLPQEEIYLRADPVRLAQVFTNLLNNACKYTESGGTIWLSAERVGSDVVVRVKDTGIGIPPEKLHGVFEMFSQVETAIDRSQGGLGIGLTLVKRLVEMHGGSVSATSEGVGKGAEFSVRLPLVVDAAIEKPLPAPDVQPEPANRRVLIVDDNKDSAESLAILLSMSGNVTATAHDGLEALDVFESFRPDVVLLDIGLPKLNGYEVARKIRSMKNVGDPMLIATTGWGQPEDREKSREAGFAHHMVKPVDYDELLRLLGTSPVPRQANLA